MKVKEIIEKLQRMPQDAEVVITKSKANGCVEVNRDVAIFFGNDTVIIE